MRRKSEDVEQGVSGSGNSGRGRVPSLLVRVH